MAAKVLDIEICERIIKVCEITKKGKGFQIHNCFMLNTPPDAVIDGQLSNVEALSETLGGALKARGFGKCNAVFSIMSGRIAVREITVPPIKEAKITALVAANAGDYFPIDISKYHVTSTLLERVDSGDNPGCRVAVYAAPLVLLEGYFELARRTNLSVQTIDYCGNSQYRAVRDIDDDSTTMYVNVGTTNTYVTFMRSGCLLLQRTFPAGGDELVTSYMAAANMPDSSYIDAINQLSMGDGSPVYSYMTSDEVSDKLNRLISNLARTSSYFNSNNWQNPVENVVLMGVCSKLAGLREGISDMREDISISYLDEMPAMSKVANATESASFYISCIGSLIAPLDLIPEQFKDRKGEKVKKQKEASITFGLVVAILLLLVGVALSAVSMMNYWAAGLVHKAAEEQIAALEYTEDVYETYKLYDDASKQVLTLRELTESNNAGLHAFLDELEAKMPSDIIILSAVCGAQDINMNLTVSSKESAALVLVQLRTFASIADIQVSALTETTDEAGFSYVSFSVSCTYGQNPYLAAEGSGEPAAE